MWHIAFAGLENQFWLSSHCFWRTRESIRGFFTLPLRINTGELFMKSLRAWKVVREGGNVCVWERD